MIKKILKIILVLIVLFLSFNWNHVVYGVRQLSGQLEIINNTVSIDSLSDDTKGMIRDILQYAQDSIGLEVGNAYSTYYDQKGEPVLWVVTASPKFKVEAHKWSMSIAGEFPYKGFFRKDLAEEELDKMIKEGHDAKIGEVSAWSSVGFFDDPILSNMLERSEGMLARTLFHELTHRNIYIKDDVDFNETFASIIGDEGAKNYLKYKYGRGSDELIEYENRLHDMDIFSQFMLKEVQELNIFYENLRGDDPTKLKLKQERINQIFQGIDQIQLLDKQRYQYLKELEVNNAFFVSYLTYHSLEGDMLNEFKDDFQGDLKNFLNHYLTLYN